ncbi:M15 family metallopeptidase [Gorillibacterium massiliense]|uniref:M15 family metallopeptidase n=1 Tax=Gorillibacterium massiliense TaxID=1280390 RepID=UPI0004BA2963
MIANKNRALPSNYIPDDLVEPNVPFPYKEKVEKRKLRKAAADALEEMFAGASNDGLTLYAVSGYRSYATQKSLYNHYVETQGEEHASRYSAKPGTSEHQTGLAMDVSSQSAGFQLEENFGTTPEGKWLAAHCAEYGFVIRYPNGKENITGYAYEPWHVRYVGKDVAQQVMAKGTTLEEFYQLAVPASGN